VAGRPHNAPVIAGGSRTATGLPTPLFESTDPAGGSALGWPSKSDDDAEPPSAPVDTTTPLIDDSFATDPAPMSIPQLIADSRRHAQFVIIEGEPAATDAQAYILTGLSDAAVLIIDPQVTTREDLSEVVDQIAVTGSELLGAVMWRVNRKPRPEIAGADGAAAAGDASDRQGRRRPENNDTVLPSRPADAAR
jgi:hypothetical protein